MIASVRTSSPSVRHAPKGRMRTRDGETPVWWRQQIRMRSLAGRLQWRRLGSIQASCQGPGCGNRREIRALRKARQPDAGLLRTRNLRPAYSLCDAQILCSRSSGRPQARQNADPGQLHPVDITQFSFQLGTAYALHLSRRQRRQRFAALLQPLAAASWKLTCFAALPGQAIVAKSS